MLENINFIPSEKFNTNSLSKSTQNKDGKKVGVPYMNAPENNRQLIGNFVDSE